MALQKGEEESALSGMGLSNAAEDSSPKQTDLRRNSEGLERNVLQTGRRTTERARCIDQMFKLANILCNGISLRTINPQLTFLDTPTSAFSDFGWQPLHNPVQPRTGQFSATWQPESKIPEPALIV